jgi:hypothetical protein
MAEWVFLAHPIKAIAALIMPTLSKGRVVAQWETGPCCQHLAREVIFQWS